MTTETKSLQWKVYTPGLLKEIMANPGTAILLRPIQAFANLLTQVGEVAARINDPELNKLMMRLAIYSIADPAEPEYDAEFVRKYLEE